MKTRIGQTVMFSLALVLVGVNGPSLFAQPIAVCEYLNVHQFTSLG